LIDAPLREQVRNDNYPDLPFPQFSVTGVPLPGDPQSVALQNRLTEIKASGGTIDYITIQIGGNDILALFGQSAFTSLSLPQQSLVLQTQFANLQASYISLLTSLANPTFGAPGAQILLVGYADPFAGLSAANPLAGPNPAHCRPMLSFRASPAASGRVMSTSTRRLSGARSSIRTSRTRPCFPEAVLTSIPTQPATL
jgi:hypothetical protein